MVQLCDDPGTSHILTGKYMNESSTCRVYSYIDGLHVSIIKSFQNTCVIVKKMKFTFVALRMV